MDLLIWVSWERQRRNATLSSVMGAELVELVSPYRGLRRYLWCVGQTIRTIRTNKPSILFVQSPSIALAFLAVTLARIWVPKIVIDAHNAGIYPFEGRSALLNLLCKQILRCADRVLVSNGALANELGLWNVLVLPDPLIGMSFGSPPALEPKPGKPSQVKVTYITSWAADEPYEEVLEAARMLGTRYVIRFTGNPPAGINELQLPSNVVFTGFIPEDLYFQTLAMSDILLVLTRRENCLTCGAYEAISLNKPVILSNTYALRSYFGSGAVYANNTPKAICEAISCSSHDLDQLAHNSNAAHQHLKSEWTQTFEMVARSIGL